MNKKLFLFSSPHSPVSITRSLVLLHFIVFIWGFTGILGKEISFPSSQLVWWRVLIAAVSLLVFALVVKKSLRIEGKEFLQFAGVGLLTAAHWICFFMAIKVSNVSVALAVISTISFFMAFVSPIIRREKFLWHELLLGVIVVFGLGLIFKFEPKYTYGIVLALIAALLAAIFSSFNSQLVKKHEPAKIAFWEMATALLSVSIFLFFTGELNHELLTPSLRDLLMLLLLGVVCTAFAFVAAIEVMKVLSPFTCALAVNLEPVYTIALALLIYGESEYMSTQFYLGTLIILCTLFLEVWLKRKFGTVTGKD
ncbi:MAG: DMT family transporter [Flavobacteriales bacterium]|nr:DMT family transporter [Flavobacteriales bacterium]